MKKNTVFAAGVAGLLLCSLALAQESFSPIQPSTDSVSAANGAVVSQSAWYNKPSADLAVDQCNILVDSVGPVWACVHRVSAMCVQRGQGYSVGYAQNEPIRFPLILRMYQPPNLVATGYVEIAALGANPVIGFNSPPTPWIQAAAYQGGTCGDLLPAPPVVTEPHYARLCRQFGRYCGG